MKTGMVTPSFFLFIYLFILLMSEMLLHVEIEGLCKLQKKNFKYIYL